MELNKDQIFRYEEIKVAMKQLEEELKTLQPLVLQQVAKDKELVCKNGSLVVQERAVWAYSEAVKSKEEEVKELKKQEQAKGEATAEYIPTLYYRFNKE